MESREPVNILLVDDQPAKLLSYEVILSNLGENLIKANSGREALECLLKNDIAVVLVDVCMPELDGFELTSMIRNHPRFRKTAIILVSGVMIEDVDRLKGYVSGAVDYVSVPIVPEILRAKVSVFADLFRKTGALEQLNQELEQRVEQRTAALSETTEKLARAYEASHLLASIVESSDDAIIGQSLSGIIRTWNAGAERLYQYKADEMLGRNISELTPPDRLDEEAGILEKLRNGERVDHFETVRLRRDGALLEVSLTISPIRNETGELIGTSQVARDVTEQKRTAELMRQTQKLESLGVLAGGIAHDFNNLLVGILGNASLALDMLPADSPVRIPMEGVVDAGERAAVLTRQMLAYSGRGHFVLNRIDLSTYVREAIPLIQASVSRAVELRLDLAEDLPAIEADIAQVQQILMNLVINGAEAVSDGGRGWVTITTHRQEVDEQYIHAQATGATGELKPGTHVVLEVSDNGCGMDETTKARIFEPFFTTKFTGRGLGLAAVLGIVRGHSGFIQVSSAPGHGTIFRVLFPALAAAAERQPRQLRKAQNAGGDGAVLVIDDEQIVRAVAQQALEYYGYTVLLAEDGERGLELFQRNADRIKCLVLDATMPVMSGEETLERLKALRADVPVILSSGFSEIEMIHRFEGKGLAGFIQKPYKTSTLLEKIKDAISPASMPLRAAGL
jgi:PAS domain S-box-containing protein